MLRKFASIGQPNLFGYAYESGAWDSNAQINAHFRMFQTYGDGLTQHSGDWGVTTEFFSDYLFSLADLMLRDEEVADTLRYTLNCGPTAEQIEFCASVKFTPANDTDYWEKKRRYYSVEEKKISSSDSKRYDKRYSEVDKNCDGSADAIYRMLIPEYADGLKKYIFAHDIHAWCMGAFGSSRPWMEMPAKFLTWTKDDEVARKMRDALDTVRYIIESKWLRDNTTSMLDNYRDNIEREKPAKQIAAPEVVNV